MNFLDSIPSFSQLEQDRWVIAMCSGRTNGRFAEIGAFDGVSLSNTFILEKQFRWGGVLIEPNQNLFDKLKITREALCLNKAAYFRTGEILSFVPSAEYGTLADYAESDGHAEKRRDTIALEGLTQVETITWDDIVQQEDFSLVGFDYISLDTEGSEWDILRTIDLDKYKVPLFTIEHNFVADKRSLINEYMKKNGYKSVAIAWDDWFFNEEFLKIRNKMELPYIDALNNYFSTKYSRYNNM